MSIFSSIIHKIFNAAETSPAPAESPSTLAPVGASTSALGPVGASTSATPPPAAQAVAPAPTSVEAAVPAQPVDVEAVLTAMASAKGGGGNWQSSIVDLLKLLDLDSSLGARKELANELGVHAGADGSAEENVALHKSVMHKLEENGGKVPESLKG